MIYIIINILKKYKIKVKHKKHIKKIKKHIKIKVKSK
jgi:hypothetical protein